MENRFKVLRVFSVIFKVTAFLSLVFLGIGVAGVAAGGMPEGVARGQVVLNMLISFSVSFLVLYSFGEIIRLLLIVEEQTRRP